MRTSRLSLVLTCAEQRGDPPARCRQLGSTCKEAHGTNLNLICHHTYGHEIPDSRSLSQRVWLPEKNLEDRALCSDESFRALPCLCRIARRRCTLPNIGCRCPGPSGEIDKPDVRVETESELIEINGMKSPAIRPPSIFAAGAARVSAWFPAWFVKNGLTAANLSSRPERRERPTVLPLQSAQYSIPHQSW